MRRAEKKILWVKDYYKEYFFFGERKSQGATLLCFAVCLDN